MPEFGWHDDSIKYLHVDVRGLEQYQRKVAAFIRDELNARLAWLLSGSRVPFGTIADSRCKIMDVYKFYTYYMLQYVHVHVVCMNLILMKLIFLRSVIV